MTKNSEQKLKYLKNEKSFQGELKTFSIILKELSVAFNNVRPESVRLIRLNKNLQFSNISVNKVRI